MNINVLKNEIEVAETIADEIEKVIVGKNDALICICAGHTPVPVYKKLVEDVKQDKYKSDDFKFISLDEWVGLGPDDPGSCIYDVSLHFFSPLGITRGERMFFFDGLSDNLNEECEKAKHFIEKNGGLDLVLLGIGMNGHIGFNEPGTKITDSVRVVELDETSKAVSIKYFDKPNKIGPGITIGIKEIMNARKIFIMASGNHKQDVVYRAVKEPASEDFPVTLIRDHYDLNMYFDEAAARKIV